MIAQCGRCSTTLHRTNTHSLDYSFALTFASLVLLIIMCTTTLMSVQTAGIAHSAYLFSGPAELVRRNMAELAVAVVFVTVVAPLGKLIGTLYVLIRLQSAEPPFHVRRVFALTERLRPWSMIEVFVFGVFVAYVKLGDLVHITLDAGVYALMALTVLVIWADSALDREAIWERLRGQDLAGHTATSAVGLASEAVGCRGLWPREHVRGRRTTVLALRYSAASAQARQAVARTWALVLAAAALYVPANYFPVLTVMQLGAGSPSTIIGGVEELVASGMYPLALLVFFASIAVPMLKLVGLTIMLVATQTGRSGSLRDRTKLYMSCAGSGGGR